MNDPWDDDWENPDWNDDDDDEETEVVICPGCGAEVYEDAEQCPRCGEYIISSSTHPFAGRGWWFIALGLIGILATIIVLLVVGLGF